MEPNRISPPAEAAEAVIPGATAPLAAEGAAQPGKPEQPGQREQSAQPETGSLNTLPRVGVGFQASLVFAFFGTWLALLPATQVTLALKVNQIDPAGKAATLSLILGVGSFIALVAQNVFGALSDRCFPIWPR